MVIETVSCSSCGGPVDVEVVPEGVRGACYSTVIVADESKIVDGATMVDDHLDRDIPDGQHAVVYCECEDCCPVCNE